MVKIIVTNGEGEKSEFEGETGISLMENLRDNDYEVEAICGGQCSCATCHVYIDGAWADKTGTREDDEEELLEELDSFKENSRLSCQIEVTDAMDGLELTIAPDE